MSTKQTPLFETHEQLGATFTDFAGWRMPLWYDTQVREHLAVRSAAGLFDLSHMGQIEVQGSEAAIALDFALVSKPSSIMTGRAKYTMLCDLDGGIIDDLVVYRLDDHHFLVVANAGNVDCVTHVLRHRTRQYDADVSDTSETWSLIAIQGPHSVGVVTQLAGLDLWKMKYYGIEKASIAGHEVLVARTGYTGEDGFEIYCHPSSAKSIWNLAMAMGSGHGLKPAGLACRDTLRLEAGMPLYGHELDRRSNPFEVGLGRVVSFDKAGGFVGDTALQAYRDRPSGRTLVGLVSPTRRSPRHGYVVVDSATGESIGHITSGAPSPTLGHAIAMAYVETSFAEPGTRLSVLIRGAEEPAEVVELPFYRRPR